MTISINDFAFSFLIHISSPPSKCLVFYVVCCRLLIVLMFFLLDFVLSVLRLTASDYPFGIGRHFVQLDPHKDSNHVFREYENYN